MVNFYCLMEDIARSIFMVDYKLTCLGAQTGGICIARLEITMWQCCWCFAQKRQSECVWIRPFVVFAFLAMNLQREQQAVFRLVRPIKLAPVAA